MPREIRVFGPPGTGKTHELATWYIPQAVKQFGPDNVIVCSFTRSAAREIAGRGIEVNEEHVGTLHALCYRILGRPELTQGHLKDWNSLHPGLALSGGIQRDVDEGGDEPDAALTAGDIFHARADIYRARLRPAPMWDSETAAFYKLWTAWKKTNYYVDFTDLIEEALQWHPEFPGRPNVIIVDEAQDFTPLQLKLIRAWGEHCDWIVLSGDDDQCIYNFTGASPHAFIQPEIDPKLIRILGQSYRCPPHITTFSDLWIKTLYNRRQEKPYRSRPGEGKIFYESGNYKFSEDILMKIRACVKGKTPNPDRPEVMILASCGYMLSQIRAGLFAFGLPFHNPWRRRRRDWNPVALAGKGRVTGREIVQAFLSEEGLDEGLWNVPTLLTWAKHIKVGDTGIQPRTGRKALEALGEAVEKRSLGLFTTRHVLTDVFSAAALEPLRARNTAWFRENILGQKKTSIEFPLRIVKQMGLNALIDPPQIVLGTIHSVKGGEAENVFLFPDISLAAWRAAVEDPEEHDAIIRLFYVGMSRTRQNLHLASPALKGLGGYRRPLAVDWKEGL